MAKAKKPRNFKFTVTQSETLEEHIATYRETVRNDPDDAAHSLTTFFDHMFTKLEETFTISEAAPREKVIDTLATWFKIKAKRLEKKEKVNLHVRATARKLFHKEMWPNVIRPAVIEELGEENSNNPNWLATMKKIEMQMWGQLTDRQRAWYTEKALEINTGKLALEAKAEYGDKHFRRSLQGAVNDAAKVFNARIIVCTVRKRAGKKRPFVSIIEDDSNSLKFYKTLPKDERFTWTPHDFMLHTEMPPEAVEDTLSSTQSHYKLIYDSDGVPSLPSWNGHPSITKWRRPFGKYMKFYWAKANGVKGYLRPKYKHIAANPDKYIHPDFLPPVSSRREGFTILKPSAMHADDLTLLIKHLLKRQLLVERGELDGEVFAFRTVHLSIEEEIERSVKRRKAKKAKGKGRADDEALSSDEEEMEIDDALQLVENVKKGEERENDKVGDRDEEDEDKDDEEDEDEDEGEEEEDDDDDEEDDEEEGDTEGDVIAERGREKAVVRPAKPVSMKAAENVPTNLSKSRTAQSIIEPNSPATISDNWPSRSSFLRSLSELPEFQHLLDLLPDEGITIAELPNAGLGNLQWATWEYSKRWVPEVVHITSFGWDSVHTYLKDWVEICEGEDPLPGYAYLGHFLFLSGLVLRDIREAYFSLNDPDDDEPGYLPQYIITTQLGLSFAQCIELFIKSIWAKYSASPSVRSLPTARNSTDKATTPKVPDEAIDPSLDITNPTTRHSEQERNDSGTRKSSPPQKRPNPSQSSPVPAKKARKGKVSEKNTKKVGIRKAVSGDNTKKSKPAPPRKKTSGDKSGGSANSTVIAGPSHSSTAADEGEATHGRQSHRLQGKDRRVWHRDGTSTVV